jgi:hypothetical protein
VTRLGRALVVALVLQATSAWSVSGVHDRPIADGPTRVGIAVFVVDVTEVDSARQRFGVNVYVEARWQDGRLARDGGAGLRPLAEVWHPRLQLVNEQRLQTTFADVVEVSPGGEVVYRQRVIGHLSQPLDLRAFPFDRQTFAIRIVAAGYTPEEVSFAPLEDADMGMSESTSVADWTILGWTAAPQVYQPLPAGLADAGFVFSFEAQRLSGYFILKVIVPLVLIVGMSWIAFWIDPRESGPQISVGVTSMLTLIAYRFMIGRELPKVSYLTRLDLLVLLSTLLVSLALLEAVTTAVLARTDRIDRARWLDRTSRVVFPVLFVLLLASTVAC